MRRDSLLAVVLIALGALVEPGLAALAQDATPGPEAAGPVLPLAPDPAKWCTVPRRPRAELETLYEEVNARATPIASPAVVEASPAPFDEPAGQPADAATVAGVVDTVVRAVACAANGGDGLRDANLLTEEWLREELIGLPRAEFESFYTENPMPAEPEQWLMVYAVRNVRVLDDGRVGANPEVIVPGAGHFRDFLIFEQTGGRWLIDEVREGVDIYQRE